MPKKKNQVRNRIRNNSSKMLVAGVVAVSTVSGVVPTDSANKAEAADLTLLDKNIGEIVTIADKQFYIVNKTSTITQLLSAEQIARSFDSETSRTKINFDPTRESNIAYYLNNTYYNSLPAELRKVIITNQKWYTGEDNAELSTHVIANVGMLRLSEYEAFIPRISGGALANFSHIYEYTMTRSNERYDSNEVWQINSGGRSILSSYANTNLLGVRPVIYVSSDLKVSVSGKVETNKAPTIPVLTVPSEEFEYGDKHVFNWDATDPDNDVLTYRFQASYNGSDTWTELYRGREKSFTYTVPSDRSTKVKFRVLAEDASVTSTSAESSYKPIREVQYYWSKFSVAGIKNETKFTLDPDVASYTIPDFNLNLHRSVEVVGGVVTGIDKVSSKRLKAVTAADVGLWFVYDNNTAFNIVSLEDRAVNIDGTTEWIQFYMKAKRLVTTSVAVLEALVEDNIMASGNKYEDGVVNSDGFKYIKGPRVLAEDITAPTIELSEQTEYGTTSKVTVKTKDLGTVSKVKWAKGTQVASYFTNSGTVIGAGQTAESNFTASENGTYTVYAADEKGNASVQTIVVSKINTPPTKPTLTIPTQQFEHGDSQIISWLSTDSQNDTITYKLEATYNDGVSWQEIYSGSSKTYTYKVPADKGDKVKFRVTANDGKATSEVTASVAKSIREVQYYWTKHTKIPHTTYVMQNTGINSIGYTEKYGFTERQRVVTYSDIGITEKGTIYGIDPQVIESFSIANDKEILEGRYYIAESTRAIQLMGSRRSEVIYDVEVGLFHSYTYKVMSLTEGYTGGTLVEGNLIGTATQYTNQPTVSAGFWYVKGQRVLSEDVTPPIVELEEQLIYGPTAKVIVKTHDLGVVATVKWAEGIQDISYFISGGNTIAVGQATPSEFTVGSNGVYTVYAIDDKGNASVQTIGVSKVNTAPTINQIIKDTKFNVVDSSTGFNLAVEASDIDGQDLSAKATYLENKTTSSPNLKLNFSGGSYLKGLHTTAITATVNDGIVDSAPITLTGHIVIKVNDASDYTRLLNQHTTNANDFTEVQHQAFYNTYEAILAYEDGHTEDYYTAAKIAISELKTATGIDNSDALAEWSERLNIVQGSELLEVAETSLDKADYMNIQNLFNALDLESNKDLLKGRLLELTKYHEASDFLTILESEVSRHKVNTDTALDTLVVNTTKLNEAKELIALTQNTEHAEYKKELTPRQTALHSYYLNHKNNLSPEDLVDSHPDVNSALTTEYDELKGAFKPINENIEHLVLYTNALVAFLESVDQTTKDAYITTVAQFPTDTGIDFNAIQKVTATVESIYNYRSTFRENQSELASIETDIQAISIGGTNTKGYLEEIRKALKEVTEYNDVALDEVHDEVEKQEATSQLTKLKASSKFLADMNDYTENGIPIIIINSDPYEYIVDNTIEVKGTITDTNNTTHVITAKLGTGTVSEVTVNGEFTISFTKPEGVYLEETLTVNANDGLTNKVITINGKPIVSVSNPTLFKELVKLLEVDLGEEFSSMSSETLTELLRIFNNMISVDINTPPTLVTGLYDQTKTLSTKDGGTLQTFVKSFIQTTYLDWLYANYETATVAQFEIMGITVSEESLTSLQTIIADYKAQGGSILPTPTLKDYLNWVELIDSLSLLDTTIDNTYTLSEATEVVTAVAEVAKQVEGSIPNWSTLKPVYIEKLEHLKEFEKALISVAKSETEYTQVAHDEAQILVNSVSNADANTALANRLIEVQKAIIATEAVVVAEASQDPVDAEKAQLLIDSLQDSHKKIELQVRTNNVVEYDNALKATLKAEVDLTNEAQAEAKALVESLMDGPRKVGLLERVEEVSRIIAATNALEKAELSINTEDILAASVLIDRLTTEPLKSNLQVRLVDVSMYAEAVNAVTIAESTLNQTAKDEAQILVNELPASGSKDILHDKLLDVQQIINTVKALAEAELSKTDADVLIVKEELAKIRNIAERERLQGSLNDLIGYIEAREAVEDSESSNTQTDKDAALATVNQLPASTDKDALLHRLEEVQKSIDRKSASDKAEDAVTKVGNSWDIQDVIDARLLVDVLENADLRDTLNAQLDSLELIIAEYEKVKVVIEKAEESKTEEDLAKAIPAIADLTTLAGGDHANIRELQNRLNEVAAYINADKAITKAETSKYQRHADEAQVLIDVLQNEINKDFLQVRLDALKESLTTKEVDMLDKIVDGTISITDQELADYTGQIVYKELLDDYLDAMREIGDKTAALTKDDVIKVIRLINSFEFAKRSMLLADIESYQAELDSVNNAIRSNYPTPQVMFATASYLEDESKQIELAEELAKLLGRDVSVVLAEMQELLAGIEEAQNGFYSVKYIDVDTNEVLYNEPTEAKFGSINFTPEYSIEGYELLESDPVTFELNKENNGKVFSFFVKSTKVETSPEVEEQEVEQVKYGSYTITYALEDGTIIDSILFGNIELGDVSVEATTPDGFELIGDSPLPVSLTTEALHQDLTFTVKALENVDTPLELATTGMYTVSYMTENNELIKQVQFKDIPLGEYEIEAELFEDYILATNEEESKAITLTEKNSVQNIIFTVGKIPAEPIASASRYSSTIDADSPIMRSMMVASLDEVYLTSTPVGATGPVSHQQYLYQAAQASVRVGAYVARPTQQNLDSALSFVNNNMLAGRYKAQLLALLKYTAEEIGTEGTPDLTAVHPYVAPVVPPTPSYNGGGWSEVAVPQDVGTVAIQEKVNEAVIDEDGSISWVIDNPLKNNFELNAVGMKISLSFEKELITKSKKLKVVWKYIGNQEYELLVLSDEKELPTFTAKIKLSKDNNFKYMQRKVSGGYKATPYKYQDGTFSFNTNKAGTFKFSNDKKTFKDIAKNVETKDAIEELASRLIIKGTSPDKFNPNAKVTRAEFAAMLTRALGLEASNINSPFKDTTGEWHEQEVQALYEAGIINGTSKSTFSPDTYLTREHAVSMLYRVLAIAEEHGTLATSSGKLPEVKSPTFKDQNKIARDAKVAIATLESLKIIQGSEGKFNPQDALTRAHLAKILAGALKLTGDM